MAQADFVVGRVVRRRHLHRPVPKPRSTAASATIGIERSSSGGTSTRRADRGSIAFVIADGPRLRRRRRSSRAASSRPSTSMPIAAVGRIADVPERRVALVVLDLRIGDRRLTLWVPVDQTFAAINQPVAVERDEDACRTATESPTSIVKRSRSQSGPKPSARNCAVDRSAVGLATTPTRGRGRLRVQAIRGRGLPLRVR